MSRLRRPASTAPPIPEHLAVFNPSDWPGDDRAACEAWIAARRAAAPTYWHDHADAARSPLARLLESRAVRAAVAAPGYPGGPVVPADARARFDPRPRRRASRPSA